MDKKPEDMDVLELMALISKLDKEFDENGASWSDEERNKRFEELNRLDKILESKYEDFTEKAIAEHEAKESAYQKIDFSRGPHLELIKHVLETGERLYIQDFKYAAWAQLIPSKWFEDVEGGDNEAVLNFYNKVMNELFEFFEHLCNFQEDVGEHFPVKEIKLFLNGYGTFILGKADGQGTDFYIEKENDHDFKMVLNWEEALKYAKMSSFEQAKKYADMFYNVVGDDSFIRKHWDKLMFCLGQCTTAGLCFQARINKDIYKEVLS